jgi:hypothetical protein
MEDLKSKAIGALWRLQKLPDWSGHSSPARTYATSPHNPETVGVLVHALVSHVAWWAVARREIGRCGGRGGVPCSSFRPPCGRWPASITQLQPAPLAPARPAPLQSAQPSGYHGPGVPHGTPTVSRAVTSTIRNLLGTQCGPSVECPNANRSCLPTERDRQRSG